MGETSSATLDHIMADGPVIPVVTIDEPGDAVPLARALVAGGVRVIELTLRTSAGIDAIRRIAAEVPDAIVGAGTVRTPEQASLSQAAGARFLVSPGLTPTLTDVVKDLAVPLLPGIATPGEAMKAAEAGLTRLKFFPAGPAGGAPMLKALHGPLGELRFCPTGGIDLETAPAYLGCPNVVCVGGSWLTPARAVDEKAWQIITDLARHTVDTLRGGGSGGQRPG